MNGAQDLGGMMGFGPVAPDPDEPLFHQTWERRAFGLTLAMGATGAWSDDALRHACESLPPPDYLTSSYYEIWIKGLTRLLLANKLVSIHELYGDQPVEPGPLAASAVSAAEVPALLARGTDFRRETGEPPRFAVGAQVKARNEHKAGHTRLPRYARGRMGTVRRVHGAFVFPDSNAHGAGEAPQQLYTVGFSGRELWGESADSSLSVMLDLWESYLEPA
jgi:nitrile hydratase subunit beta